MQFTGLSSNDQERFKLKQAAGGRKPSYRVWIDGLGDCKDYVTSIVAEAGIEESYGAEHFKIGWADVEATNDSELFYASGSLIDKDARINIWAGFDDLLIPIFTGYVEKVQPSGANQALIHCKDNMGLMYQQKVEGDQDDNDTPKELIEYFCDETGLLSDVPSSGKTDREFDETYFFRQTLYTAMKNVCDHIFCVVWFDERGRLQFKERERGNQASWTFRDGVNGNVRDVIRMADSDIVNSFAIEYKDYFISRLQDSDSIDSYRERQRTYSLPLMNSEEISSYLVGASNYQITTAKEVAFKFTSPADAEVIDCVHLLIAGSSDVEGDLTVKAYNEIIGKPGTLLGTSRKKGAKGLITYVSSNYSWAVFEFENAIEIDPSAIYWVSLDLSGLTDGSVYWQGTVAGCVSNYAELDAAGDWTVEHNKNRKHKVYGSGMAYDVTQDMLAFYKDPRERLQIIAPGVPQLQMIDEVIVDVEGPPRYLGAYVIEARRHIITPWEYTTVDALREA